MSEDFLPLSERFPDAGLQPAGKLPLQAVGQRIPAQQLSIGCECLDRDYWQWEKALPALRELSPGWARLQSGWAKCERSPGVYDFAWLDQIVTDLLAQQIKPWVCVCYGNPLYYPEGTGVRACPLQASAAAAAAWPRYLEALARHYQGRVQHFEVWNEPELSWGPTALRDAADYVELVAVSSAALRRGNPTACIIGGAAASGVRNSPRYHGFAFAAAQFAAGLGKHIDAYSYHAYDVFPELVQEPEKRFFQRILARYGLENLPLWQGEGGCPACWQKDNALSKHPWTEAKQAKHLLRNILCDLRQGAALSSYFMLSDFVYRHPDGSTSPTYYGLLSGEDYRRRPAFYAYQSLTEIFAGQLEVNDALLFSLHKTTAERTVISLEDSAGIDALRTSIQRFAFTVSGRTILAWHRPVNPHRPEELFLNTLLLEGDGLEQFREPLLLDPVTQQLYRPTRLTVEERWGSERVRIDDLPVLDYPLFLLGQVN